MSALFAAGERILVSHHAPMTVMTSVVASSSFALAAALLSIERRLRGWRSVMSRRRFVAKSLFGDTIRKLLFGLLLRDFKVADGAFEFCRVGHSVAKAIFGDRSRKLFCGL
jgi:hypothetical protein